MKTRRLPSDDRILDLLADETTVGLADHELAQLDDYFHAHADEDRDGLACAAAAIHLATLPDVSDPPPALMAALASQAAAHFARQAITPSGASHPGGHQRAPFSRSSQPWKRLAIAALVVIAVGGWWLALSRKSDTTDVPGPIEQLAMLESEARDVVHAPWASDQEGYESVAGEVIWSDSKQCGFMRLSALPVNDPKVAQYQLWIVDPDRDKNPVDGGVFNITDALHEVLVPIDAKLNVSRPTVFAITLEKPGGVVVSDGPLLVIAATKG